MTTNTTQPTPDYSDMTNTVQIRSSIKRLFGGSVDEIVAELLQNAQRAGASEVRITTSDEGGWTFADNGHGLKEGLDGFWTLLRLAESYFNNPTIHDQAPMGLGIHALLAHEAVAEVTFSSGNLTLAIDTSKWWSNVDYYTTWQDRVVKTLDPVAGLHISVRCTPNVVTALRQSAAPQASRTYKRCWSPFQGYTGYLSVTLDGEPVVTDPPAWTQPKRFVIKTEYMGQALTIGGNWTDEGSGTIDYAGSATVCWFGQMIEMPGLRGWSFYLNVREGKPVNPKSPTRQGVIEDGALAALHTFVQNKIFKVIADPKNRGRISPTVLEAAHVLDSARAQAELPFVLVAPYEGFSEDELNFGGTQKRGAAVVMTYDEVPFLLRDGLYVDRSVESHKASWMRRVKDTLQPEGAVADQATEQATPVEGDPYVGAEYGLDSFIALLKAQGFIPYELMRGDSQRLPIYDLYWKPGAKRDDAFNEPGTWGISSTDAEPETWYDVTGDDPVFSFSDPSSYDPDEVDWVVGTTNPKGFLAHDAWYAFSPADDEDYDSQEEQYGDSLADWRRSLVANSLPTDFQHYHIQRLMPTPKSRITSVRFHYPRKKRGVDADKDVRLPIAITASNAAGERKRLLLVA